MLNSLINFKKTKEEKEYILFKSLLYQIDSKIKLESDEISKTIKELEQEVPIYINNILNLNEEIKNLRVKLHLKNHDSEPSHFINNKNIDLKNDLTIKYLYKIISSKCHPDKTNDGNLNNLFILANEAYQHNNYSIILDIYNKLLNKDETISFKNITIEQKLELIKKEYNFRKEEYNNLLKTNGYVIKTLINNDNITKARKLFLELLFNQTLELEQLKNQLKNNLNKGKK